MDNTFGLFVYDNLSGFKLATIEELTALGLIVPNPTILEVPVTFESDINVPIEDSQDDD